MSDPDRYKSRGRKERTPEQLKVLAMAREKARLVIAERTKIKREMTEPHARRTIAAIQKTRFKWAVRWFKSAHRREQQAGREVSVE